MGSSTSEKYDLATYQLKDIAQAWYVQWTDSIPLRGGPMTWKVIEKAFLDRFFPKEKREDKLLDFINLRQGCMSVLE